MRQPTPDAVIYAYWRRATGQVVTDPAELRHLAQRHDEDPEAGFYRVRLRKGAPWAPVRIWMDQPVDPETGELDGPETMHCEMDGRRLFAFDRWWLSFHAITETAYAALLAERDRPDAVGDMMRATAAPVDLSKEFVTP